jgi:hypothetical protein
MLIKELLNLREAAAQHVEISNEADLKAFMEHMSGLEDDRSNPWRESQAQAAMKKLYVWAKANNAFVMGKRVEKGKAYIMMEGGCCYSDSGHASQYFQRGAVVVIGDVMPSDAKIFDERETYVEVHISGRTFKVIADGSFGNESSLFSSGRDTAEGRIPLNRLVLVDPKDALTAIK